jgi:hypothetical protein
MSAMVQRQPNWEDADILQLRDFYGFNPLHYPICTRLPQRHNVMSAWIGHVPFAMCLVDMVKPRVLVELGTHWGTSYCAFCQAVKELRLPTECFAVDTWQGDAHASFYTGEVLEDLKAHHDERYSLFSKLVQSTFENAVGSFEDKVIDVLHIDGYHTHDAVKNDFETWLPKMSDRGVVLFHDIEVRDRPTFGVWRFWDQIKQKYPHFAFYHSYGLGVLAVGECVPEEMRALTGLNEPAADRVRQYFTNLGDHLTALHNTALQKENLAELLHAKTDECSKLAEACARLEWQHPSAAALEAALDAERQRVAYLQGEVAALDVERQRVAYLQGEVAARDAALGAARAYQSQLRFRAADKTARMMSRVPFVYRPLRFTVRRLGRMLRRVKLLIIPAHA